MTSRIVTFFFLLLLSVASFSQKIKAIGPELAATSSPVPFGGRYLFKAELHTVGNNEAQFVEAGIMVIDLKGNFSLTSTYNSSAVNNQAYTQSPNVLINGVYSFDTVHGWGSLHAVGASDAFSSDVHIYCTHTGDYCTIASAEVGRPWQGRMWRDNSGVPSPFTMMKMGVASYVFETDSSQNFFIESGVIAFDGNGNVTLQSDFNEVIPGSIIQDPSIIWALGSYGFNPIYGNAQFTQWFKFGGQVTDTEAIWCLNDGSRCVAVPDAWEAGSWVMELTRQ